MRIDVVSVGGTVRGLRERAVAGLIAVVLCIVCSPASAAPSPRFPPDAVWHQNIANAPLHPQSAAMITQLEALGGWGQSNRMHIDFSLHVRRLAAGETPPLLPVVQHAVEQDYYAPDCEPLGTMMPVPADAAFEGETGLQCDNDCSSGECGDCHLIVVDNTRVFELYHGNLRNGQLDALCLVVWDTSVVYPPQGRGEHCTSADAAGFPIAALLPNADGVAAAMVAGDGDLGHAIRFILPNARMASDVSLGGRFGRLYVRPASHAGGPSGPADSVPYGARLRLRADFDMSGYNAAARVILRTMQRYGIVLADGGNVALTFESDRFTTASWSALGITPQVFWNGNAASRPPVKVSDFSVIDTGPRIAETYQCERTEITPGAELFRDGFES